MNETGVVPQCAIKHPRKKGDQCLGLKYERDTSVQGVAGRDNKAHLISTLPKTLNSSPNIFPPHVPLPLEVSPIVGREYWRQEAAIMYSFGFTHGERGIGMVGREDAKQYISEDIG